MASVSAIRAGLAARLATISGLRAHATVPGQITPPCAVVEPGPILFDQTMGRGSDQLTFRVLVLVSAASDRAAQTTLDGYLAGSGASSVKTAVEGDETLGGVAHFARVAGVDEYGDIEYAGISYLGASFAVEVVASGS